MSEVKERLLDKVYERRQNQDQMGIFLFLGLCWGLQRQILWDWEKGVFFLQCCFFDVSMLPGRFHTATDLPITAATVATAKEVATTARLLGVGLVAMEKDVCSLCLL